MSHSDTCFSRHFNSLPAEKKVFDQGDLRLASCIVVQDSENKVFLTLRSTTMKIFPNSWVLPGGHIEPGESLEEGAIRELFEETGIKIMRQPDGSLTFNDKIVKLRPYFVFESSIPPFDRERKKYDRKKCP